MSKNNNKKLVQVYRAKNEMEAQVIKTKLEAYGIPSLFKSNAAFSVFAFTVDGMGEVKIMVPVELAEEAKKIITEENDGL